MSQAELALLGQVGGPVGDGVALLLGGDLQGGAHSLAGLLVPALALRVGAEGLPELLFQLIGAGVVAPADEERLGVGDLLQGIGRTFIPLIFAGSSGGPMMTKSL